MLNADADGSDGDGDGDGNAGNVRFCIFYIFLVENIVDSIHVELVRHPSQRTAVMMEMRMREMVIVLVIMGMGTMVIVIVMEMEMATATMLFSTDASCLKAR